MGRLPPISIRAKLIAVFSAFIAAVTALGLWDLRSVTTLQDLMREVHGNSLPGVRWAMALKTSAGDVRTAVFQHILATDEAAMDAAEKRLATALAALKDLRAGYETRLTSAQEQALYEGFSASLDGYQEALRESLTFSRQYAKEAAAHFYNEKASRLIDLAMAATDEIVAFKNRYADVASERADEAGRSTLRRVAFTIVVTLLVSFAAAAGLIVSISRGIASVIAPMRVLAAGDLSAAVPTPDQRTEIGMIAAAVQVFKDALIHKRHTDAEAAREAQVKIARAQKLQDISRRFEASVGALTERLAVAAEEMEATARSLSQTAANANEQATTVAASAAQTSGNVRAVAAATEELASSIREITRQMTESSATAQRAVENVQHTDVVVQSLAESAQRIGSVVALISGVASQTNLLALNATIEAARAGEAGKGFAVVANEVKALANQTTGATNEIASQIEHIQGATMKAVAAIREIAAIINVMNGTATEVAMTMEQQGAATQEIAHNVQNAAVGTQQVSGGIDVLRTASGEAGSAASQVLAAAQELARHSTDLGRHVQVFLAEMQAA